MTADRSKLAVRTPTFIAILGALLLTSLGVNAVLVHTARRYVEETNAVRLDPAGLKVYATERPKPRGNGPLLVLFGDSRAAMWPAPPMPSGYRVVNRGIGYQTTAQILLRLDKDLAPLRPNVVVVEAGVNDLKTIAEFPDRRDEIVADCKVNLARIVDECRRIGADVVLVNVFGIGDVALWRRPFWSPEVRVAVRDVNAFLPSLVREGVVLFDANAVLADPRGEIQRAYQVDYLHISPPGYAALNAALNQILLPVLSTMAK